jgi:hypothetical protein
MRRFKVWVFFAANLLLLVAVADPALAKRKRPTKPAADAVPATEVEPDAPGRTVAAPGDSAGESPPDKERAAEKVTPPLPAPPPVEAVAPRARPAPEPVTAITRAAPAEPRGASRLTGHVGVGSPLVTLRATRSARHVSSVSDELTLLAPIGLGMRISDVWTFDFEFQVSTGVRPEGLTTVIVDPGLIYTGDRLSGGLRVSFQTNANQNIGLTPLMRLAILRNADTSWFVEASLPAFVQNKQLTASTALQTGVTF